MIISSHQPRNRNRYRTPEELIKKRLDSNTRSAAGTYQEQTKKIIVLPGPAILAPPGVYPLCLDTGGTALFTALHATVVRDEYEDDVGLSETFAIIHRLWFPATV
ncbi:hypothetical protein EVAR_96832_1 [Eumeta japonica]|uniref:Uncharacterized protein n=1 Tax=Eumeta variegata TaxID=151549 RepID=A0A4C1WB17_EUMVA|nr:hypothetical protein EVAR_96832_1 [Eumeta japonica]